jgi:hypothetical protein
VQNAIVPLVAFAEDGLFHTRVSRVAAIDRGAQETTIAISLFALRFSQNREYIAFAQDYPHDD